MKLMCDCGREPTEVDKLRKTTGYQYTEETVGYYHVYECACGERYWEFKPEVR